MSNTAERGHRSTDQAAHPRMPAPRQAPVIGKRLGKSHADARTSRGGQAHQKASSCVVVAKAAAKTGASVETEPSISPAKPG